jgi:hypothetical protein
MNYVYVRSEAQVWTVGFHDPSGKWNAESDHSTSEAAAQRVHYLNGGVQPPKAEEAPKPSRQKLLEAMVAQWTAQHGMHADSAEGWSIFDSDSHGFEIERADDADFFESDDAAELFVVDRALGGHEHAITALAIVAIQKILNDSPEGWQSQLMSKFFREVDDYDAEMNDPGKDGSGEDARAPTGDDYNFLHSCIQALRRNFEGTLP